MVSSKLYELFDTLPRQDIRQLKKAVASPFFNQRQHVEALLDYLIHCKFERKVLPEREEAFARLFPERRFDDHKLRLSMSLLLKVMEQYLIYQQVNAQEVNAQLALARAYRALKLPRHFKQSLTKAHQLQKNRGLRHAEYYQDAYALRLEEYRFHASQRRMEDLHLQPVQENLEAAFITAKLRQSCFALSHRAVYTTEYNLGMLPEMLTYIRRSDMLDLPSVAVYYYCYLALTQPEEHLHFEKFKALTLAYQALFPKDELRDLFLLATNFCIRQMNKGVKRFAREGLSIYREGLSNQVLLLNGQLSRFTYRNIVAKAIVARELDWAVDFVHQYKTKLEAQYRESTFCFNLAWLEYERKHYDLALDLINRSAFSDLLLNLSAKTIAMKIYFELGAYELLYAHLEAMRNFINRKKIMTYHKTHYLNMIKFTKKLLDLPPVAPQQRARLKANILGSSVVAEKNWLLSQLP